MDISLGESLWAAFNLFLLAGMGVLMVLAIKALLIYIRKNS